MNTVADLDTYISALERENAALAEENDALKAHIKDLEHDFKASEEHCQEHHAEVG